MKGGGAAFLVLLALVLMSARQSQAAVSCSEVTQSLIPCMPYLTQGGNPTRQCCEGVKNLVGMTTTQQDRRAACHCVKDAASRLPIKADAASSLPDRCDTPIGIPISATTNCDNIS